LGGRGAFAVITSSLSAPNQSAWLAELKARLGAEYPEVRLAAVRACDDVEERARAAAAEILGAAPDVRALVGLCSPGGPRRGGRGGRAGWGAGPHHGRVPAVPLPRPH